VASVCVGQAEGAVTGKFFMKGQAQEPKDTAADVAKQQALWEQSLKDAGIDGPFVPNL